MMLILLLFLTGKAYELLSLLLAVASLLLLSPGACSTETCR